MVSYEKRFSEDTGPRPAWHDSANEDTEDTADSEALLGNTVRSSPSLALFWRRHCLAILVHSAILCLYSTIALITLVARIPQPSRGIVYSPANEAVQWNVGPWVAGDGLDEVYVGHPRPELEAAWEGLLKNMNIRISKQDVEHYGRLENAVALPDGSGYVGTLNVYHEIHCVRWLYKYLYQDIYWPGLDAAQRQKNLVHSEHCLSALRKFAICHGDVGLVTYSWHPEVLQPAANATEHACIAWDSLAAWSEERAVDMFRPGFLVHPTLGPAYPDGEPVHGGPHEAVHTLPSRPNAGG